MRLADTESKCWTQIKMQKPQDQDLSLSAPRRSSSASDHSLPPSTYTTEPVRQPAQTPIGDLTSGLSDLCVTEPAILTDGPGADGLHGEKPGRPSTVREERGGPTLLRRDSRDSLIDSEPSADDLQSCSTGNEIPSDDPPALRREAMIDRIMRSFCRRLDSKIAIARGATTHVAMKMELGPDGRLVSPNFTSRAARPPPGDRRKADGLALLAPTPAPTPAPAPAPAGSGNAAIAMAAAAAPVPATATPLGWQLCQGRSLAPVLHLPASSIPSVPPPPPPPPPLRGSLLSPQQPAPPLPGLSISTGVAPPPPISLRDATGPGVEKTFVSPGASKSPATRQGGETSSPISHVQQSFARTLFGRSPSTPAEGSQDANRAIHNPGSPSPRALAVSLKRSAKSKKGDHGSLAVESSTAADASSAIPPAAHNVQPNEPTSMLGSAPTQNQPSGPNAETGVEGEDDELSYHAGLSGMAASESDFPGSFAAFADFTMHQGINLGIEVSSDAYHHMAMSPFLHAWVVDPSSSQQGQEGGASTTETPDEGAYEVSNVTQAMKRIAGSEESDPLPGYEVRRGGDGDGRRKKPKAAPSDSVASGGYGSRKFACPYFKRNPRKYRNWTSCPGPGWEEVHRVKTHLYRRHALPIQCPRCWDVFKADGDLQSHLQKEPPCTIQENRMLCEGFTKDQEKKLRSRKKTHADMTDQDKWREIYMILFPDDDQSSIPSPYYSESDELGKGGSLNSSGELEDYATFIRREMPTLVRRELETLFRDEFRDIEEKVRPRIAEIVLNLQPKLLSLYKQSQLPLSEYGPQQHEAVGSSDESALVFSPTQGSASGAASNADSMPTAEFGIDSFFGGTEAQLDLCSNGKDVNWEAVYAGAEEQVQATAPDAAYGLNWDFEFDKLLDPVLFFMPSGGAGSELQGEVQLGEFDTLRRRGYSLH
ncbi:hypothetical protein VTK56DRAFT_4991 [Thermocarpiscus australiensis]